MKTCAKCHKEVELINISHVIWSEEGLLYECEECTPRHTNTNPV